MASNSAKKAPAKKVAKKAAPVKKATPAKKATPVKKAAPTKKAAKKATPVKKAAKKAAPTKKATPVKKAAKKATPVKKAAPAKRAAPVTKAPTIKKEAKATKATAVKSASEPKAKSVKEVAAPVAPPAPVVPVVNPIAGADIPQVRKAVPGKKPAPKQPTVQEDQSNWNKSELETARKLLEREAAELVAEIAQADEKFQDLIFESGEGAGDDQADAGTKTFEREQEISLLANKRDLLDQTYHALERIAAGTYGRCENCGNPIGKLRLLEANPRATLCMPCRQKQDRS